MTQETSILIIGAGAVGAFYASRLAVAPNTSVSAVCRSSYTRVKSHGFNITSPSHGSYTWRPTHVFRDNTDARAAKLSWDYIVVSTKALPDAGDDSELLEGLVGKETAIVLIQNGLGVEEPYVARFPEASVSSAVTIISAAQVEPGAIRHNRWTRINSGPFVSGDMGKEREAKATELNQRFVELLTQGGIKDAAAYSHSKLQLLRWHKLIINATFNPSAVLSGGSTNSGMAHDVEMYIFLQDAMQEIKAVAEKLHGEFPKDFASPERILESTKKNTSGSKPSMLLDWEEGRRMELEVILGNPIRIARDAGLAMPRVQTLYALLKKGEFDEVLVYLGWMLIFTQPRKTATSEKRRRAESYESAS